jgi:hypothetical protein
MNQLSLLTTPSARRTDPQTSHAAAESMREIAATHHYSILRALRTYGPMGKCGIARWSSVPDHIAVARRLSELERLGKVRTTGRTVKSNTGRNEREWCAI